MSSQLNSERRARRALNKLGSFKYERKSIVSAAAAKDADDWSESDDIMVRQMEEFQRHEE